MGEIFDTQTYIHLYSTKGSNPEYIKHSYKSVKKKKKEDDPIKNR